MSEVLAIKQNENENSQFIGEHSPSDLDAYYLEKRDEITDGGPTWVVRNFENYPTGVYDYYCGGVWRGFIDYHLDGRADGYQLVQSDELDDTTPELVYKGQSMIEAAIAIQSTLTK